MSVHVFDMLAIRIINSDICLNAVKADLSVNIAIVIWIFTDLALAFPKNSTSEREKPPLWSF